MQWGCLDCDDTDIVSASDNPKPDGRCKACKNTHILTLGGYVKLRLLGSETRVLGSLVCMRARGRRAATHPRVRALGVRLLHSAHA